METSGRRPSIITRAHFHASGIFCWKWLRSSSLLMSTNQNESPTLFIRLQWSGSPTWFRFLTAMELYKPERRPDLPRVDMVFNPAVLHLAQRPLAAAGRKTRTGTTCFPKLCKVDYVRVYRRSSSVQTHPPPLSQSTSSETHRPLHPVRSSISDFRVPGSGLRILFI